MGPAALHAVALACMSRRAGMVTSTQAATRLPSATHSPGAAYANEILALGYEFHATSLAHGDEAQTSEPKLQHKGLKY
jgi:hypothetical protein